jgi:hypothetical protein
VLLSTKTIEAARVRSNENLVLAHTRADLAQAAIEDEERVSPDHAKADPDDGFVDVCVGVVGVVGSGVVSVGVVSVGVVGAGDVETADASTVHVTSLLLLPPGPLTATSKTCAPTLKVVSESVAPEAHGVTAAPSSVHTLLVRSPPEVVKLMSAAVLVEVVGGASVIATSGAVTCV